MFYSYHSYTIHNSLNQKIFKIYVNIFKRNLHYFPKAKHFYLFFYFFLEERIATNFVVKSYKSLLHLLPMSKKFLFLFFPFIIVTLFIY
jgi:hypothetical protein